MVSPKQKSCTYFATWSQYAVQFYTIVGNKHELGPITKIERYKRNQVAKVVSLNQSYSTRTRGRGYYTIINSYDQIFNCNALFFANNGKDL
jgi:hypothetical protein